MFKKTLLSVVTCFALCGPSIPATLHAQELDLDEIDIFGDTTEPDSGAQPPADTSDVFGDPVPPSAPPAEGGDPYAITEEADVLRLMEQAKTLADEGNCDKAIEIYSAILNNPANPQLQRYAPALYERGKCFVEIGELQMAEQAFDLASQYAGPFPGLFIEALLERGKAMLDMGRPQEALEIFNQAASANPIDAEVIFLRGKAQARVANSGFQPDAAGLFEAIRSFTRAIKLREDYVEAYEERAAAYSSEVILELDKAIDDYEQASTLSAGDPNLEARRGSAYQRRADRERLRRKADVQQVIDDYRAAEEAYAKYLETEEGKTEEDYEEAPPETITPNQVYVSRASTRIALGHEMQGPERTALYEKAIDDANRALDFTEDLPGAYFQRAIAERLLGRMDESVETYTKLAEVSPQSTPEIGFRRGIISYHQGELLSAREAFLQAMEFITDGRAAFWAGVTFAKMGDYREAERLYTRAIRENPGYLPAYNNRGLVYMRLGHCDRAYRDFDFLVRRDHHDHVARQRRDAARRCVEHGCDCDPFDFAYDQLPYTSCY